LRYIITDETEEAPDVQVAATEENEPADIYAKLHKAIEIASSSQSVRVPNPVTDLSTIIHSELAAAEHSGKLGYYTSMVYQRLLTISPTSVESERAFSAAGVLCTRIRSRLSNKTIDKLCFLSFKLFYVTTSCLLTYNLITIVYNKIKFQ
jgi:hypothetical protein